MRYKLLIAYDGTHYSGWQVQKDQASIQALIQSALRTALRHPLDLTGSGRTDAGVHALGQTAHFDSQEFFKKELLRASLNALLPPDIRIREITPVPPDFHARYSAKAKIYHYHLHLDRVLDPFQRLYRHQPRAKLDLVKQAASHFIGTHDFTSFANEKASAPQDPIRTISRLDIKEQKGGVRLEFEGDGFLYKMVRNITGTLLDAAAKKIPLDEIPKIFEAKDRRKAGSAAPPQGLFLVEVLY